GDHHAHAAALRIDGMRGFVDVQPEAAAQRQGLDGIDDEIGKHLADFAGKSEDIAVGFVAALNPNSLPANAAVVEGEHAVEHLGELDGNGGCRVAVEAERLFDD